MLNYELRPGNSWNIRRKKWSNVAGIEKRIVDDQSTDHGLAN